MAHVSPGSARFLFALMLVVAGCTRQDAVGPAPGEYLNWSPEATLVGKEVCGECHRQNYDTYVKTQMGRSYKKATYSNSDADWDDPDPVYDGHRDLWYQPFRRGEDLFVQEYRLRDRDTLFSRIEQIDFIVGSGQHTNSHVWEENGYLHQVPITYYTQDGMWSLAPGFSNNNARFLRPMRQECVQCHNARPTFVPGSENRFTHVPEGIDCEQCHGPGSVHTEAMRAGRVVDITKEIDYTIVHPGKISPQLQMDICRRCHLQAAEVINEGLTPADFRPGKPLLSFQNVYWPRQPDSTTSFVMAFHPDRMEMSACFRGSWAGPKPNSPMTCVTCHNPHLAVDQVGDEYFSAVCRSCHAAPQQKQCTDPGVVAGTETAPCFQCHMPTSGTSDIPHVRITDHYIRKPDPTEGTGERARRTFLRMASLIDPKPTLTNRAEGFLTYFELVTDRPGMLDSAAVLLERARGVEEGDRLGRARIRLWFLKEDWAAIRGYVRESPDTGADDAWTQYRIGEAFAQDAETGIAITHVERAVSLAPDNVRFGDRLGRLLTDAGDLDRALQVFDRVLTNFPKYEPTWTNRGYVKLASGDFGGAEADYLRAMELDPDAELAMASLASIYLNTGRLDEARRLARELIRRKPDDQGYVQLFQATSD